VAFGSGAPCGVDCRPADRKFFKLKLMVKFVARLAEYRCGGAGDFRADTVAGSRTILFFIENPYQENRNAASCWVRAEFRLQSPLGGTTPVFFV